MICACRDDARLSGRGYAQDAVQAAIHQAPLGADTHPDDLTAPSQDLAARLLAMLPAVPQFQPVLLIDPMRQHTMTQTVPWVAYARALSERPLDAGMWVIAFITSTCVRPAYQYRTQAQSTMHVCSWLRAL